MKRMSFSLTPRQYLDGSKTATSRLGWANLKPGEHFMGVEKCMGIPKGGHQVKLGESACLSNTPTRLRDYTQAMVNAEGFPDMTPEEFVAFFCKHMTRDREGNRTTQDTVVNYIEFEEVGRASD